MSRKLLTRALISKLFQPNTRQCSTGPGLIYEKLKITNKQLDVNTLYQLDKYSRYSPAPISIKKLLDSGKSHDQTDSYLFLKKEIPTRLANMIMELKLLPEDLLKQKECAEILDDYITSFKEMLLFEKQNEVDCLKSFNETLNIIRRRHLDTVPLMARAVIRLNSGGSLTEAVNDTIQYFLNRLYTNRISIHMLISHYNALCGQAVTVTGMVGTVEQECDIARVASQAYNDAAQLCDSEYLAHPEISITALDTTNNNQHVNCVYVPSHLHHIFFEIFKNSMRATLEFAEEKSLLEVPDISCQIFKTVDDITIKVSDRGGGIRRATRGKIFQYMYSTAPSVSIPHGGGSYGAGLEGRNLPMHGLGYGLPLSRLYARYFKGDIQIASVDGYGTDVFVYLQSLSHMAQENLPVYNAVSSARLQSVATQVPDWTSPDHSY